MTQGPDTGPFFVGRAYTCLRELREAVEKNDGMDYVQIFDTPEGLPNLWFIEDGAFVTALLPEEY